mgnify:CR=1 FL=1
MNPSVKTLVNDIISHLELLPGDAGGMASSSVWGTVSATGSNVMRTLSVSRARYSTCRSAGRAKQIGISAARAPILRHLTNSSA